MNHPNRSRRKSPGYSPSAAEIRQLREEMSLGRTEFGALVYADGRTVEAWEQGLRRMPGLAWEFVCLLNGFPEVERARKTWVESFGA